MTKKISAGLLMYRTINGETEVFLAHPGGPLFAKRDEGYWTIPKGELVTGEDYFNAAIREFKEETGITPTGEYIPLGQITQKTGKIVHAWAFKATSDHSGNIKSNLFELEWPPNSGIKQMFPEIDRAEFFQLETAKKKIKPSQIKLIERLENYLQE